MSEYPVYAEGYVAEVLEDGHVVVWPEITPDHQAELISSVPVLATGHYFAVDVVLQPPQELFAEEDDAASDWEPTRWHRLITPDGELWMETSDPEEIEGELSGETYRNRFEDAEEGETIDPPPEGLVHQRLYQAPVKMEWRNVDG